MVQVVLKRILTSLLGQIQVHFGHVQQPSMANYLFLVATEAVTIGR